MQEKIGVKQFHHESNGFSPCCSVQMLLALCMGHAESSGFVLFILLESCIFIAENQEKRKAKGREFGTSLAVQWVRLCLSKQGMQVPSPVGVLRPHLPRDQKSKTSPQTPTKQKQHCNKVNKDFRNGPPQKKKNQKKEENIKII